MAARRMESVPRRSTTHRWGRGEDNEELATPGRSMLPLLLALPTSPRTGESVSVEAVGARRLVRPTHSRHHCYIMCQCSYMSSYYLPNKLVLSVGSGLSNNPFTSCTVSCGISSIFSWIF